MTLSIEEARRAIAEAEQKRSERDQARGALAEIRKQVKREFGCSSSKEVDALLARLAEEEKDAERKALAALAEHRKHVGDRAGGVGPPGETGS